MTHKEQIEDLKKEALKELNKLQNELNDKIKELKESKENTYIYETNHLQCSDGELHIGFGDVGENERWLVWNIDSLFKDLPFIISQVVKENDKQQNMYLDSIKDSLKEIK